MEVNLWDYSSQLFLDMIILIVTYKRKFNVKRFCRNVGAGLNVESNLVRKQGYMKVSEICYGTTITSGNLNREKKHCSSSIFCMLYPLNIQPFWTRNDWWQSIKLEAESRECLSSIHASTKNVGFLLIRMSRKASLLMDSFSRMNFMESCWKFRYWREGATLDSELKNRKQSSTYVRYKVGLNSLGHSCNDFSS